MTFSFSVHYNALYELYGSQCGQKNMYGLMI